jgi:hypothetical protein
MAALRVRAEGSPFSMTERGETGESEVEGGALPPGGALGPFVSAENMAFDLTGKDDIAAMWRFECSRGLAVSYRDIRTEGAAVNGHWA